MTVDASIVVVTHDSAEDIDRCLCALLEQDYGEEFELIVVDSGSTDGTPELVRKRYETAVVIDAENRGFGSGNNLGAQHARGKNLAFINPDTVADNGWLRALLHPLSEDRTISTSKIVLMDEPALVNTCGNQLHFSGFGFVNGLGQPTEDFRGCMEVDGISGAAFAMRRQDFLDLGGFDEGIFLYCEDSEFSVRATRSGYRICVATESVVRHGYKLELSPSKMFHLEFGRWFLLRKHCSLVQLTVLAPSLILSEGVAAVYALRFGVRGIVEKFRGSLSGAFVQAPGYVADRSIVSVTQARVPFELLSSSPVIRLIGKAVNALYLLNGRLFKSLFQ